MCKSLLVQVLRSNKIVDTFVRDDTAEARQLLKNSDWLVEVVDKDDIPCAVTEKRRG
jgi:hypothetical protein